MPIPALVGVLAPIVGTLVDRLIPDKAEAERTKAQIEVELTRTANEINLAQIEVNKTEAAHRNVWVAGWRPGIGWVCAAGFAWVFLGAPVGAWLLALIQATNPDAVGVLSEVPAPVIPIDYLFELTMAMLGMASLRTYEKLKGVAK